MGIAVFLIIVILQILASGAMPQEMVDVLVPSPSSPTNTSSGVYGSLQCTKNSDESYAVCASISNTAIKYNLQPFSFAAKGPNHGYYMYSCDLFETASQSTSRAVCVKGYYTNGVVYFHRVSDMINVTNVTIGVVHLYPHVIVDTPNQIAYVSNYRYTPAIYKITNIGGTTPIVAGNVTSFGSGDIQPTAMLIIDEFLYGHFFMAPARLARINITTFKWNKTVIFPSGENGGYYDNLASDDNFIYDLTAFSGILVRCTYKNNNFARFDSLSTGLSDTNSLAISPDFSFLLFTASSSGIVMVNISTFSVGSRALCPKPTSSGYDSAQGRPIILSKNKNTNTYPICAFSQYNDYLYTFNISRVPFREAYPTIYPLPSSPINTSSGVSGSLQCTKNSDESYAVCASISNTAIKYNLQPFSFAAKGPDHGDFMNSCDLYETTSQSTSRAVCVKATIGTRGIVYFREVSDMINITNVTVGITGQFSHVIVDTPNQVAYVSNNNNPPAIYKITNIGSSTPIVAGNVTSFGSGDAYPAAMLIVDGYLYVRFAMNPVSSLARINISTFTWNQTVNFTGGEDNGYYDNLANDDNFIYDLTSNGILVRFTYKNRNFTRFDSLKTELSNTYSLTISPDQRTLFVVSQLNSLLQMVDTTSFSKIGSPVMVPAAFGRPIVTSTQEIFAFGENSEAVYAFRFNLPTDRNGTPSAELVAPRTASVSLQQIRTESESNSVSNDSRTAPSVSTRRTMARSRSSSDSNDSTTTRARNRSIEQSANTTSRSSSVTATRPQTPDLASRIVSISISLNLKKTDLTDHVLTVATNAAQSIGIVAVAAAAAVSPSLGFGVARQQAMVNFVQNVRARDCSGISDPNQVPAADSPTQMKIGASNAKLYVGGAVGNTILSISLILAMQIVGTIELKFSGSSSWNRPFDVFARCNVAFVGYVCASLLLAPTLTFGLVTVSVSNIENLSVGSKILAIIFSVVFAVPTFYYAIWSVLLRPNMKFEQYRKLPKKSTQKVSVIVRMQNFFFEGEGEWMLHKKANLKEKLNFDAATPMFEGYNGRAKWFGIVEFVVQVGLAFAPFLANLVPVQKSCGTTFSVLIIVLGGYLFLCIWLRPFQEVFNRIVVPLVTLCQIGVVILTYVYADNPPEFMVLLAMLTVSLQNVMIVIVLIASFSPLMKHALKAFRKLKGCRTKRNQQKRKSDNKNNITHRDRVPSQRYPIVENDEKLRSGTENREKNSKNDGSSARNKNYEQGDKIHRQKHQQRTHRNSDMKASLSMRVPSAEPQSNNINNKRFHDSETTLGGNAERRSLSNRRENQHRNLTLNHNENNNRAGRESSRSWHDRDDRHDGRSTSGREQNRDSLLSERKGARRIPTV